MEVCLLDHGGFVGGVVDLTVAVDFEGAAMPGVDCCFGARGESVLEGLSEFRAKELGGTAEKLYFDTVVRNLLWRGEMESVPSPLR